MKIHFSRQVCFGRSELFYIGCLYLRGKGIFCAAAPMCGCCREDSDTVSALGGRFGCGFLASFSSCVRVVRLISVCNLLRSTGVVGFDFVSSCVEVRGVVGCGNVRSLGLGSHVGGILCRCISSVSLL